MKVKDKEEMQAAHTYTLIKAKILMKAKTMKQKEDRQNHMIVSRKLPLCVPFRLLSS